jgi:hypothetical protein
VLVKLIRLDHQSRPGFAKVALHGDGDKVTTASGCPAVDVCQGFIHELVYLCISFVRLNNEAALLGKAGPPRMNRPKPCHTKLFAVFLNSHVHVRHCHLMTSQGMLHATISPENLSCRLGFERRGGCD